MKTRAKKKAPQTPRFPRSLPASYGKGLAREYREALGELKLIALKASSPHDAVLAHAVETVRWLGDYPRARVSTTFVERLWLAVREWVALLPDRPTGGLACARCGENRPNRMMGCGIVTQHAVILSIAPPVAHIQPTGCTHQAFVIECTTCGAEISSDFAPAVGPAPTREAPKSDPSEDELKKKWSIN